MAKIRFELPEGVESVSFEIEGRCIIATYEPKRKAHKLEECVEMIEKGEMPLESYILGHPEAKLTAVEKKEMMDYFKKIQTDTEATYQITTK